MTTTAKASPNIWEVKPDSGMYWGGHRLGWYWDHVDDDEPHGPFDSAAAAHRAANNALDMRDLLPGTRYAAVCRSCGGRRVVLADIHSIGCGCISAHWLSLSDREIEQITAANKASRAEERK